MIKTKRQFLELYMAGKLGNRLRTWPSLDALMSSRYKGPVTIRSRKPSWKTMYGVPQEEIESIVAIKGRFYGFTDLYFNESAPDDRLILQGEYHNDHTRYFMYSRAQLPMKDALALPLQAEGLKTEMLLRASMDANSWDDFQILRDGYPGHVIEFGVYECELGNVPGRNCIIWELRDY